MSRVYAVTNEYGERHTLADTVSPVDVNATPIDDRKPRKKNIATGEIYDLGSTHTHGVLANYLMHTYDLYLRKGVKYGSDGRIRWIEVDGVTYWERKDEIFDPNKRRK